MFGMAESTVNGIIEHVAGFLDSISADVMRFPDTPEKKRAASAEFEEVRRRCCHKCFYGAVVYLNLFLNIRIQRSLFLDRCLLLVMHPAAFEISVREALVLSSFTNALPLRTWLTNKPCLGLLNFDKCSTCLLGTAYEVELRIYERKE